MIGRVGGGGGGGVQLLMCLFSEEGDSAAFALSASSSVCCSNINPSCRTLLKRDKYRAFIQVSLLVFLHFFDKNTFSSICEMIWFKPYEENLICVGYGIC